MHCLSIRNGERNKSQLNLRNVTRERYPIGYVRLFYNNLTWKLMLKLKLTWCRPSACRFLSMTKNDILLLFFSSSIAGCRTSLVTISLSIWWYRDGGECVSHVTHARRELVSRLRPLSVWNLTISRMNLAWNSYANYLRFNLSENKLFINLFYCSFCTCALVVPMNTL